MSGLAFRFQADTQRTREHYRCPGACAPPVDPVADRATIAAGTDVALGIWRRTVTPGTDREPDEDTGPGREAGPETCGIAQLAAGGCSHFALSSR